MVSPSNYGEWCKLFDEMEKAARDDAYVATVSHGSISWTSGVAERFVQSASNMMRNRINKAQDVYQSQMKNSMGSETCIARALQVLTKEYRYLYQFACALPIPDEYRSKMAALVQDQADQTFNSLMDSAKSDRTGKLASIVRSAGVNKLQGRS